MSVKDEVINRLKEVRPDLSRISFGINCGLISELGFASIDGADLACSLCDDLGIEISEEENPLVKDVLGKKVERTVNELVRWVEGKLEDVKFSKDSKSVSEKA